MLDRHAVQELLRAGLRPRAVAQQFGVSRRTVERIALEGRITSGEHGVIRTELEVPDVRGVGRPRITDEVKERVTALLLEDPDRPPGEISRLLREEGAPLGLSTVYRVLKSVKSTIPASRLVRFEGVAGEYAQFDFGEVSVRPMDGSRRTVHFAAYRLKYSRWVHVEIVPNEKVEALIRSLLASFEASGGVPLRVVFDNPKTVVVRHEEGRPVWNAVLAPVTIDYACSRRGISTGRAAEQATKTCFFLIQARLSCSWALNAGRRLGCGGLALGVEVEYGLAEYGLVTNRKMGPGTIGLSLRAHSYSYRISDFGDFFQATIRITPIAIGANYHFAFANQKFHPFAGLAIGYANASYRRRGVAMRSLLKIRWGVHGDDTGR